MKSQAIKKTWFNTFAETCYELEDGTTLYISYDQKSIRVTPAEA